MSDKSMNLIKQVSIIPSGMTLDISDEYIEGYIKSENGCFYIGIPFLNLENRRFLDRFVGFKLESGTIRKEDGQIITGLYLYCSSDVEMDQFAYVGFDFLSKSNRKSICENPYSWTDKWRSVFGDAIGKEEPSALLGELLALSNIYKNDKTAVWVGAESGSQDISCKNLDVEVKTTKLKKDTKITINSAIQLGGTKPQELFLVRLELKPHGITIDDVVKELDTLGYDRARIEKGLSLKGYPNGSRVRQNIGYDLIEIRSYEVNENNFPLVSLSKLNECCTSKNIIDYTLTVDLTNKTYKSVFEKKKS